MPLPAGRESLRPRLPESVAAWGSEAFERVLKRELGALDPALLPLQQGMSLGSQVVDEPRSVLLLDRAEAHGRLQLKVGLFFTSVIAGCNCADDPTPVEGQTEYCELLVSVDTATAAAVFQLCTG